MFLLNDSPDVFSCLSEITDYKSSWKQSAKNVS